MPYYMAKLPEAGPILVEVQVTLRRLAAAALWQAEEIEAGRNPQDNVAYSMAKYAMVLERLTESR